MPTVPSTSSTPACSPSWNRPFYVTKSALSFKISPWAGFSLLRGFREKLSCIPTVCFSSPLKERKKRDVSIFLDFYFIGMGLAFIS